MYQTSVRSGGESHPVVVVHCSDPRYQPHFQEFLKTHMKLDRYGLVAIPGGPQCFTLASYLPKFAWSGWRWMKFMVNLTNPARLILIGHDDCRWYIENRFVHDAALARQHIISDMQNARAELNERFPGVPIELFYATLVDGKGNFEKI
jgi:hypothetical protein